MRAYSLDSDHALLVVKLQPEMVFRLQFRCIGLAAHLRSVGFKNCDVSIIILVMALISSITITHLGPLIIVGSYC